MLFFFQAEDGIRYYKVTGVQTCALPICSIYDTNALVGLSHLVSQVLDRGTQRRTTDQIAEALDERGVSLSVSANRHVMNISCRSEERRVGKVKKHRSGMYQITVITVVTD